MSFGYSIGDFIAGANLSYRLVQALSDTQCASVEFREALMELGCLQQTFLQVGRMLSNPNLSAATINAAAHIVLSSITLIGEFLTKTEKYRARLAGRTSGSGMSSWQKVGWALFKKEELKDLKDRLHVKLSSISVLLQTAKFYERAPTLVAEYEEPSPPPSYSHLASETILPNTANNASTIEPRKQKLTSIEARFARLEGMLSEQRNKELARVVSAEEIIIPEVATIRSNFQTSTDPTPVQEPNNDRVVRSAEPIDRTQGLSAVLPKQKQRKKKQSAKATELIIANSSDDTEIGSYSVDPETIFDVNIFQEPDNDAAVDNAAIVVEPEVELSTRPEKTFRSQRADETNATGLISELEKALLKFNLATEPDDKKKSIKLKDAVGRKFSFPFHLCSTWAGMEELIRQAFVHVDVIGPHVAEGHYDLIGPNGEIILPQVWETMVEPDWSITMHMWPMPEPKGPPPACPPGRLPPIMLETPKAKGVLGWMGRKIASAKKKVHLDGDDSDSSSDYRSLVDD